MNIERLSASTFLAIITQIIFIMNFVLAQEGNKLSFIFSILMSIVIICLLNYAYYVRLNRDSQQKAKENKG